MECRAELQKSYKKNFPPESLVSIFASFEEAKQAEAEVRAREKGSNKRVSAAHQPNAVLWQGPGIGQCVQAGSALAMPMSAGCAAAVR